MNIDLKVVFKDAALIIIHIYVFGSDRDEIIPRSQIASILQYIQVKIIATTKK